VGLCACYRREPRYSILRRLYYKSLLLFNPSNTSKELQYSPFQSVPGRDVFGVVCFPLPAQLCDFSPRKLYRLSLVLRILGV
jgi:hypothetical protein